MEKSASKYKKYVITELKSNIVEGGWTEPMQVAGNGKDGRVLWLDNEMVPGAFYVETVWAYPTKPDDPPDKYPQTISNPHTHDYDEVLSFFGTNFNDPHDLGGEVDFWLGGEKQIITKSAIVFIPKGLQHCPLIYRKVNSPIFIFSTGPGQMYF